MAIKIKFDNEQRALPPTLVLATRSGHKLGCIPAQHIVFHGSLANGYELSCSVSKYDNWEKIELWDTLEDFKLAWSPEWDVWFELDVTTNEADDTVKNITATSIGEAELSQVMLYNIEINTETDIAREDYKPTIIYNPNNHTASLLDRIMEKTPHYKIRHVDSSIAKLQRTFTFDGKSLRDALLEVCKEVNALLIIHSGTDANGKIERAYSIYDLEEHCTHCGYRGEQVNGHCPECGRAEWSLGYGDDTGIFVSRENLADDITYETAKDSVKNCFRLVAGDDLMTAAVAAANPNGTPYLWYISDKVREDMSPALRNRLKEYDDLYKATQDSSFSFTSTAIRNYNALAAKYGKNQIGTVEKFAGVLDAYYDTIDFELHLEHGLLPDVNPPLTSAADELRKLIANLSPVSVRSLSTLSSTTASSYVTQAARSIIDPRYSVTTQNETLNGNLWSGSFIITRYSDEEDTATSAVISVSLDENYENYIRRQIERVLNTTEFEDLDIVELFKKSGTAFASAIKQYSLAMLKSFYDACQACLNVLVEHNSANESIWAEIYHDLYEPYYAKLGYLQAEISLRESEIGTIQMAQAEIESVITSTQKKLDFEKFMGEELWLEFAAYRREDTYQNDNYISDGLDNAALVENARDFLKTAQEDIERSATLQHSISANLSNLLVMEEFQGMTDNFELGNWLRIRVDDTVYILRLIDYEIDFDNLETLTVEYSDVVISPSSVNDIKSVLNSANSMASSYGSVSRQAKHGDNSQRQLDNWVTEGLEATKVRFLSDAQNQNITWDENGMLFRKWDDITESYEPTQLRIINSTIAVTDDNWKTVKTAVGGFDYTDPVTGEVKHGYGINAELLVGKLILGEELGLYNANNSLTFDRNGLTITNGDNSFMVSPDGSNLLVVECEGSKVMWVDDEGGLHLRPTSFELTTGETLQDAIDEAKKARNLQIILTNEYEGIPTDSTGKYTEPLSVTTGVITYYGADEVTSQCKYTTTASEGVMGSWNSNKYEYTITALSADSGYVDITAEYIDDNEAKFTVTKRFNVAKLKTGRGVKSTLVEYVLSDQGTQPPGEGWQEEMPEAVQGMYLWTRTITSYTDNSSDTTVYTVSLIGQDGVGITNTEVQYQKSSSGTDIPSDGGWTNALPFTDPGDYIWTRTAFYYTNGKHTYSYSVSMIGITGAKGDQGIPGTSDYFHIKYMDEANYQRYLNYHAGDTSSTFVAKDSPDEYIGTNVDSNAAACGNTDCEALSRDYEWYKIKGAQGEQGIPGDGYYMHIKYMTAENYTNTFEPNYKKWKDSGKTDEEAKAAANAAPMTEEDEVSQYVGLLVDKVEQDSNEPVNYNWSRIEGTDARIYSLDDMELTVFVRDPVTLEVTPDYITYAASYRDGNDTASHTLCYADSPFVIEKYWSEDGSKFVLQETVELSSGMHLESWDPPTLSGAALRFILRDYKGSPNILDVKTVPIIDKGKDGTEMTPEEMFNKLSEFGALEGVWQLQDGHVYINGSYIQAGTISGDLIKGGTLTLGGMNNSYGQLIIYGQDIDPETQKPIPIGSWDESGIHIYKGSIDSGLIQGASFSTKFWKITEDGVFYDNTGSWTDWDTSEPWWWQGYQYNLGSWYPTRQKQYNSAKYGVLTSFNLNGQHYDQVEGYFHSLYVQSSISVSTESSVAILAKHPLSSLYPTQFGYGKYYQLCTSSMSSIRYKDVERPISQDDIKELYSLPVMLAKYKDEYLSESDERFGKYMPMFIAEDVEKVYPLAVDHNAEGQPENWNYRIMIPIMFQMIKDQKSQLDELKSELAELKKGN